MTTRSKGIAVLVAQVLLVSSVAAKYAWERHVCPRVWTRAAQYDPQMPLRGRYLALDLQVSACGLREGSRTETSNWNAAHHWSTAPARQWNVLAVAEKGKLVAREVGESSAEPAVTAILPDASPCDHARLLEATEFFVAEHAQTPFPLRADQELWAEVTVPQSGPPRPIQLAISDAKGFRILDKP